MAEEKIGLQDFGTGIDTALEGADADWAAAADVGAAVAAAGGEIIVAGFEFADSDVDTGAGEATIPAGQAVLLDSDVSDGRTSMEWLRAAFPVRHPGGTVALATSGETNVWLDAEPQATTPDQVSLVTGSTPTEPRLLLGTIGEDGTVTLQNRHRSPTYDEVEAETVRTGGLDIGGWDLVDVTNHGIDTEGGSDVSGDVTNLVSDNTLLVFPPGDYLLSGDIEFDADRVGIKALPGATFIRDSEYEGLMFDARFDREGLLLDGLKADYTEDGTGGRFFNIRIHDDLIIRDCRINGPHEVLGAPGAAAIKVTNPTGHGRIERFVANDGSETGGISPQNPLAILCDSRNEGTIEFVDCELQGWEDFGLRNQGGTIHVKGGSYRNCGSDNIRFQGAGGSTARDVTVAVDDSNYSGTNNRGIWIRSPDCHVSNCNFRMEYGVGPAIDFSANSDRSVVRDTHIEASGEHDSASIETNGDWNRRNRPKLESVTINANHNSPRRNVIQVYDPFIIEDCNIEAHDSDSNVHGIELRGDIEYVTIRGGTYVADGLPINAGTGSGRREYTKVLEVSYAESLGRENDIECRSEQAAWVKNCTVQNGIGTVSDGPILVDNHIIADEV